MKPFDLQKALAGEPVITRDGRKVRVLCGDRNREGYPVVALIDNGSFDFLESFTQDGFTIHNSLPNPEDLFMAPKIKTRWFCVYKVEHIPARVSGLYNSKQEFLEMVENPQILQQYTIDIEE